MSNLKALSLVLAMFATTGLLLGTFGFSAASADRGVSVAVADDDSALIGYESSDVTARDGENVTLVAVENQFPGSVDVTDVSVDAGNFTVSGVTMPSIGPGSNAAIAGEVNCDPGATETVEVAITLEGSGVTASISGNTDTREFAVTCSQPQNSSDASTASLGTARFMGAGNFEVNSTNVDQTNVTYWTKNGNAYTSHTLTDFDPSEKLQRQTDGGNPKVVAVYFPEFDVTFVHPRLESGIPPWKSGKANRKPGKYDPNTD